MALGRPRRLEKAARSSARQWQSQVVAEHGSRPRYGYLVASLLWVSIFVMMLSQSWQALLVIAVLTVAVCGGNLELLGQDDSLRCANKAGLETFANNTVNGMRQHHHSRLFDSDLGTDDGHFKYADMSDEEQVQIAPAAEESDWWVVRPSPGKGFGVFAKKHIPRGTRVLVEEALFSIMPPEMVRGRHNFAETLARIEAGFRGLSPAQKSEYLACHDHHGQDEPDLGRHLYIFRSNAYNMPDGRWGMFLKMARINHSCKPNVANGWAENAEGVGGKVAWALRDIEQGEEILITYVRLLQTREQRQRRLDQYGFQCQCDACRMATGEADARRSRMGSLLEQLDQVAAAAGGLEDAAPRECEMYVGKAEELVGLLEEDGLGDYLARAYRHAASFSRRCGNTTAAVGWAEKELSMLRFAGEESVAVAAALEFMEGL